MDRHPGHLNMKALGITVAAVLALVLAIVFVLPWCYRGRSFPDAQQISVKLPSGVEVASLRLNRDPYFRHALGQLEMWRRTDGAAFPMLKGTASLSVTVSDSQGAVLGQFPAWVQGREMVV
jgi:hypothetical protein